MIWLIASVRRQLSKQLIELLSKLIHHQLSNQRIHSCTDSLVHSFINSLNLPVAWARCCGGGRRPGSRRQVDSGDGGAWPTCLSVRLLVRPLLACLHAEACLVPKGCSKALPFPMSGSVSGLAPNHNETRKSQIGCAFCRNMKHEFTVVGNPCWLRQSVLNFPKHRKNAIRISRGMLHFPKLVAVPLFVNVWKKISISCSRTLLVSHVRCNYWEHSWQEAKTTFPKRIHKPTGI